MFTLNNNSNHNILLFKKMATLMRMAKIKKTDKTKYWQKGGTSCENIKWYNHLAKQFLKI